mgnify:CR=1 FL=1
MNWKNMTLAGKIATVISGIAVAVWLIHQIKPDLFPIDPTYPSISLFTPCEAVVCWKTRRTWSYLLIAAAVICFASFILGLSL